MEETLKALGAASDDRMRSAFAEAQSLLGKMAPPPPCVLTSKLAALWDRTAASRLGQSPLMCLHVPEHVPILACILVAVQS